MYKKILVPLDGSKLAECVLPHVDSISKGCDVQNIIFLHVVEPFHMPSGKWGASFSGEEKRIDSENRTTAEKYLSKLVNRIKYDGVTVQSEVMFGKAAESIVEYATKNAIDLITIATHGRSGVSRCVWGSVADLVLRSTCVPVLMVRAPGCVLGI